MLTSVRRTWLPYAVSLVILGSVLSLLLRLENPVAIDDGLRHFAMGQRIAEQGMGAADWGHFFYEGYFALHHTDPWFLSDVLFAPLHSFTPVAALRIFALASIALLLGIFLFVFRLMKIPATSSTVLLMILIFFEPTFFYRLLVGRPYALMTVVSIAVMVAVLCKRYWILGLSLLVAVLLSHLFVFPLAIAAAGVAWRLSLKDWKAVKYLGLSIALGTIAGFLLHPTPLLYIHYIVDVFLRIPFLKNLEMGTEMHSGIFLGLRIFVAIAAIILMHATLKRSGMKWARYNQSGLSYIGALALLFGIMFLFWLRAIDFLWPTLVLLMTLLLSVRSGIALETVKYLSPKELRVRPPILILILLALCSVVFAGVQKVLVTTDDKRSLEVFTKAFASVPLGSKILNADWHLFSSAVVVRPDLKFAAGIDPSFTALQDPVAAEQLAFLMHPDFQLKGTQVDTGAWLTDMLAIYPADYLVLFTGRHQSFIEQLEAQTELWNISGGEGVAVFPISTAAGTSRPGEQ